jgi:hypothetical protein
LKALHDKERADNHHTTLLLNCYTKLKDDKMMDEFIMGSVALFELPFALRWSFVHVRFIKKKALQRVVWPHSSQFSICWSQPKFALPCA